MVFTSPLGLGIRQGAISRSSAVFPIRLRQSNLRSFSSVLQTPRLTHRQASLGARSFFWRSSPAPSAPVPPVSPAESPPVEVTPESEAVDTSTAVDATDTPAAVDSEAIDTSTAFDATNSLDPSAGIDPSTIVEGIPSDLTETLISNVPAALQYGDMAALGLAGWSPAGIIRWSLELINVSTGMPWFWTIVAGSALWRLVCVPFGIRGIQVSGRLLPHQPQLQELQKTMIKCRETHNPMELKKASQAINAFYKAHNLSPFSGLVSLFQLPVTFGMFLGVQKMCNLPLEQLRDSGVSFLPDLTVSDPTMVLPIAMFVLMNVQIKLSVKDFNTIERPEMAHLMNIFRLVTIPGIYFMSGLPSGLLISLLTTTFLTMMQTVLLRLPAVRSALKIPIIPVELQGKLPRFRDTFGRIKSYFTSDVKGKVEKARREAVARERMERTRRY